MFQEPGPTPPPAFSIEAQIELLTSGFERYSLPSTLKPGMLCREKAGLGLYNGKRLFLYIRPLDKDNHVDTMIIEGMIGARIATNAIDCVVMIVEVDGSLKFLVHDTSALEAFHG
jgi:hypothetical protein